MRAFLLFFIFSSLDASASVQVVKPFNGQKITTKQGAFYVDIKLDDDIHVKGNPAKIQVDLYSESKKDFFTFNHELGSNTEKINETWVLPIGTYRIVKLSVTDISGAYLQWYSKKLIKKFIIKNKAMANLGIWNVSKRGTKFLSATFSSCPNVLDLHKKQYFGFNEVIDGFSGVRQSFAIAPSPIIP